MRVLIVCSGNDGFIQPFIKEQAESLRQFDVDVHYFVILGKGIGGYLKNLSLIGKKIKELKIDLIHAHYGLSGLLSVLQRKVPVVITFHGSDIHIRWVRILSSLAARLAVKSIFVSKKISDQLNVKNCVVIPCGVNTLIFDEVEKQTSRKRLGLDSGKNIILFASSFNNKIKNYPLAKEATGLVGNNHQLVELAGYNREELKLLLNASDLLLLTSFSEGSPQIIKEAMACNCPIVATDVGDIKDVVSDAEECYVTSFNAGEISDKIKRVLDSKRRSNGRKNIMKLDTKLIAKKIISVYENILQRKALNVH